MSFLVLSAKRYDFTNDDGERVAGTTFQYFDPEEVTTEEARRGVEVMTISADADFFDQLHTLPGMYELTFKQRPGRNGRPTLSVTAATFVDLAQLPMTPESFGRA